MSIYGSVQFFLKNVCFSRKNIGKCPVLFNNNLVTNNPSFDLSLYRVFGRYQEFSCDECVSVKSTQIFFRKAHKANLSDCFHLLTQREELCKGEEWYCSTCKGKKAGIKKLDLLDTPDVIVVHLKRFRQVN